MDINQISKLNQHFSYVRICSTRHSKNFKLKHKANTSMYLRDTFTLHVDR